jgi:hypothetical protein
VHFLSFFFVPSFLFTKVGISLRGHHQTPEWTKQERKSSEKATSSRQASFQLTYVLPTALYLHPIPPQTKSNQRLPEEELPAALEAFTGMVCASEHTYLYSQAILSAATAESVHGDAFRRLSQELEANAIAK